MLGTPGLPDSLELRPLTRTAPGPGEVEIEVLASGLNFRDVLIALDMYDGPIGPLGSECAGRISAIGPGVADFAVGDEVVAFVSGGFASHVTAKAALTWHKPSRIGFEQGAGLPVAFLTAAYSLLHLGQVKAGDRVLIHAAAGGVGMAAVQLAKRAGAEVFGTAGSPAKRALLESQGVDHVMDSRSLDFADQIRDITNGEGVDFVLNSLAGDFIAKGLSVVRPGGCFVELGRAGIWSAEQVAELGTGIDYHAIMVGDVCDSDPALMQGLGAAVFAAVESGELQPLPARAYPIANAPEAYRFMAQAQHTGKLVLTMPGTREGSDAESLIAPDAAYLVTGGLGDLGLETARWLVAKGANHLVLMGRRGAGDHAEQVVAELEHPGATIEIAQGDVASEADVRSVIDSISAAGRELRGVVHAAGVVDDGVLSEQTWTRFGRALSAKVDGTRVLHELTREFELDLFVLYSSAASLLGPAGQSSYAAANAYMDAVACWRRKQGLPATSVSWGPWSELGMFARGGEAARRAVTERGFVPMTPGEALDGLGRAIATGAGHLGVFRMDWSAFQRSLGADARPPILADLLRDTPEAAVSDTPVNAALEEIRSAPAARRAQVLQRYLLGEVAHILESEPADVSPKKGFREMGMDSLLTVELRNRIEKLLGCSLRSSLLFDHPNVEQLTAYLLSELVDDSEPAEPTGTESDATAPSEVTEVDEFADMSDEEAERLLLEELALIRESDENG